VTWPPIEKAIALGIADIRRGDRRRASTYSLTWLPLYDDTPPTNRFTECDAAADAIIKAAKEAKRRSTSGRRDKKGLCLRKWQAKLCLRKWQAPLPWQMAGITRIMPTQMAGITPQTLPPQMEGTL
jgi:hypothetical protein